MNTPVIEEAKKIITYNLQGDVNGFLIELFKQGDKTPVYLTCAHPNSFKGFHLHTQRISQFICIRGAGIVIVYFNHKRHEYELSAENQKRIIIPTYIPTGLLNKGTEDCWLINYPQPPYNPHLKNEQLEFTEDECERGLYENLTKNI